VKAKLRFSFLNALTSVTATSEDSGYPASNLLTPRAPFIPWKSTSTATQTLSLTMSEASDLILLVRANFTEATIGGVEVDLSRNFVNWRYQLVHLLSSGVTTLSVVIPTQATTDGASYFSLGGIWAGPQVLPPLDFRFDVSPETLVGEITVKPDHGGWAEVMRLGEPRASFAVTRVATKLRRLSPGRGDSLQSWSEIDRQCWEAEVFAMAFNAGDDSAAYVCRRIGAIDWNRNRLNIAEGALKLEEVIQ
jgi:hypothetical protein